MREVRLREIGAVKDRLVEGLCRAEIAFLAIDLLEIAAGCPARYQRLNRRAKADQRHMLGRIEALEGAVLSIEQGQVLFGGDRREHLGRNSVAHSVEIE